MHSVINPRGNHNIFSISFPVLGAYAWPHTHALALKHESNLKHTNTGFNHTPHQKLSTPRAGCGWISLLSVSSFKTLTHDKPRRGFGQLWQKRPGRLYLTGPVQQCGCLTCFPQVLVVTHHETDCWLSLLNMTPEANAAVKSFIQALRWWPPNLGRIL